MVRRVPARTGNDRGDVLRERTRIAPTRQLGTNSTPAAVTNCARGDPVNKHHGTAMAAEVKALQQSGR